MTRENSPQTIFSDDDLKRCREIAEQKFQEAAELDERLKWIAVFEWFDSGKKTQCPENAIFTFSDIRAYIKGLGKDDRGPLCEDVHNLSHWLIANSLDRHKGKNQMRVPREVIENEALVCYFRGFLVVDDDGVFQEVGDFESLKPFAMVAVTALPKNLSVLDLFDRIDAVWIRCRKAGYTGPHPFRSPVRACQKDATAREITEADDITFPFALRSKFGSVSIEEIEDAGDYYLPAFEPFDAQLVLDLNDMRTNQLAKHLPIRSYLADWNILGRQGRSRGYTGAVPLWLKLFLEALVCADRFQDDGPVFYRLEYLYKLMYGDEAKWDKARVIAIRKMIDVASRTVVVLPDGVEVPPVNFNKFEGLEKDSRVFVMVGAEKGTRGGVLTAISDLRDAYRWSIAKLQACLSASEYLDRVWTQGGSLLYDTIPVKNDDGVILDKQGNPMTTKTGQAIKVSQRRRQKDSDAGKEAKQSKIHARTHPKRRIVARVLSK